MKQYTIIELQRAAEILEMLRDDHPEHDAELTTALDGIERMART